MPNDNQMASDFNLDIVNDKCNRYLHHQTHLINQATRAQQNSPVETRSNGAGLVKTGFAAKEGPHGRLPFVDVSLRSAVRIHGNLVVIPV